MWGPISAQTRGFLSLLGLKNTGRNPGQLLDDVRPVVEMAPWYLAASAITQRFAVASAVAQSDLVLGWPLVPDGQLWWVLEYSVSVQLGFGTRGPTNVRGFCASIEYRNPTTYTFGQPVDDVEAVATSTAPQFIAAPAIRDVLVPGGSRLSAHASLLSVRNSTPAEDYIVTGYARYVPLVV